MTKEWTCVEKPWVNGVFWEVPQPWDFPRDSIHHDTPSAFPHIVPLNQAVQLAYLPGHRVQPGPRRVSDNSVFAERVIYEILVLMREIGWTEKVWRSLKGWWMDLSPLPFPKCKQCRKTLTLFSHQNRRFIKYVFWRNWSVRNPAGTRLDSLDWKKKQVAGGENIIPH